VTGKPQCLLRVLRNFADIAPGLVIPLAGVLHARWRHRSRSLRGGAPPMLASRRSSPSIFTSRELIPQAKIRHAASGRLHSSQSQGSASLAASGIPP